MTCEYCGTEHPPQQIANPHYCIEMLLWELDIAQERIKELEAALKAQGAGKEEIQKETSTILDKPVSVAPVVLTKATPKIEGGPIYRTIWKARILNEQLIPREYLTPDMVKINAVVRSMKGKTNIPGVESYEDRV